MTFMIGLAVTFVLFAQTIAHAQPAAPDCLPGLPCITPNTPNDPWDDVITPNLPDSPNALKSTRDTCDADFMNQIYARASLEAERENRIIETIIRKPDSVLEYTCFESQLNNTAYHAPPIFSETIDFSTAEGGELATIELDGNLNDDYEPEDTPNIDNNDIVEDLEIEVYMGAGLPDGETHLGNVLQELILASLKVPGDLDPDAPTYIDANFAHTFLGGDPLGFNNGFTGEIDPTPAVSTGIVDIVYVCAQMNVSWQLAKCQNFSAPTLFYNFNELALLDPRILPEACPAPAPPANGADEPIGSLITIDNIMLAENDIVPPGVPAPPIIDTTPYPVDFDSMFFVTADLPVFQHVDFFQGRNCLPPVPTGVVVTTYEYNTGILGNVTTTTDTHNEHICINPGCFYDPAANQCRLTP